MIISEQEFDYFKKWIVENGGRILEIKSEKEIFRFKGTEEGCYFNFESNGDTYEVFKKSLEDFRYGLLWRYTPKGFKKSRGVPRSIRTQAIKRDGTKCFYCNKEMGDDVTGEHLIPESQGGKRGLPFIVLAHQKCNQEAGTKTLIEKIDIRVKNLLKK